VRRATMVECHWPEHAVVIKARINALNPY
jgi:hypothetical protein